MFTKCVKINDIVKSKFGKRLWIVIDIENRNIWVDIYDRLGGYTKKISKSHFNKYWKVVNSS